MSEPRTIKFLISKEGNVAVDGVCGVAPGPECLEATKLYEQVLGSVQESTRELTEETGECHVEIENTQGE